MLLPFKDLPPSSRIWIYQSNRFLEADEISKIKELAYTFVNEWTAHKQTLHAGFEIYHNLFLVLAVDENVKDASGCSIDTAFKFMQQIEKLFELKLFDRMLVATSIEHEIELQHVNELADYLKSKENLKSIFIFNNIIQTKSDLEKNWLQHVEESWVMNFVKVS